MLVEYSQQVTMYIAKEAAKPIVAPSKMESNSNNRRQKLIATRPKISENTKPPKDRCSAIPMQASVVHTNTSRMRYWLSIGGSILDISSLFVCSGVHNHLSNGICQATQEVKRPLYSEF